MIVVSRPLGTDPVIEALSKAERAVLVALVRGASNAEIAALRRTSPRTIANQIAALFRTVGVGSRFELAARFADVLVARERE